MVSFEDLSYLSAKRTEWHSTCTNVQSMYQDMSSNKKVSIPMVYKSSALASMKMPDFLSHNQNPT